MPATTSNIRTARIVPGASSKTYKALPLDTRLTVPEVFAHHAKNSPDHTYFVYADNDHIEGISYSQLYAAQLKVARVIAKESKNVAGLHSSDSRDRPVIGILAVTDSITYGTLTAGIMQSGAIPFPISTRNSAAAVAHLYRTTGIRQAFVSDDRAMQALSEEASDILAKEDYIVQTIKLPLFSVFFNDEPAPELRDVRLWESSHEDTAIILHSSGTSSFPKPIHISHHAHIAIGTSLYFGEVDPCGHRLGLHAAPMFHALGSFMQSIAMMTGLELAVSKPQNPPVVPNADSLLAGLVQSKSDWVLTVPALLEEWSRDPEAIETLKQKSHVKRIMFGGGPLNRAAGDLIVSHGIHIDNVYGLTEAGLLNLEIVKKDSSLSKEWEYFRFPPTDELVIELVSHDNGLVEPVLMAEEYYYPSVINTHINGKPGFATGDLLQPHPTIEGAYKIHGRADEQIMLSTGEKTNPVPLERILHTDPNVAIVLFFGRGRFYNGVLIQPCQPFDSKDEEKLAAFRSKIWPTVQKMNDYAPAHSRLLKEMIIVTNPAKPLEVTAKGSVRRNVCLAQYESEIEELYKVVAESSESAPPAPSEWTPEATLSFVRSLVQKVLQKKLNDTDDLFQHGSDSLNATWIRNSVLKTLRSASIAVPMRQIPQTFVYQHPSIRALSDYIYKIVTGDEAEADEESILSRKMAAMQEMAAKYSSNFRSPRVSTGSVPVQETVVVTGTTGRLGSHLLEQYIRDPTVRHVYALNRGSSRDADPAAGLRSRQKAAFAQWEIDTGLLDSDKVTILPSDYADEHLGLDDATYAEIEGTVTTIVHNAWRVDFNVGLSGFEPLVAGVRHIVDLAANAAVSGGARVLFVSSISVLFRHPSDVAALEQPITDPRISTSMGYGESKWVSETVILNARKQVGLRGGIVRVGQISGDTRVGAWNKQEWVGAMARVGQIVNALPICEDIISWVPVDITAATLIEMARSDEPVLHLVSPQPVSWDTVFGAFSRRLGVPLIPYSEWAALVAAAAEANTNEEDVSALALSDFFQAGNFGEGIEITTKKAVRVSSALANMRPLSEEDALKYLAFWEKIGHLKF